MNNIIKKPKAILLDLDDTISAYDSVCEPAWLICCDDFIKKHQPAFTSEELLNSIHYTRDWYWADPIRHKRGRENLREARREVVRFSLERLGETKEEKVMELADHYTDLQDSMLALLPGSKAALELLKGMGIRLAVITNGGSEVQREKLKRFEITDFFEEIFIDSEIGYSKPDKEIFMYAMNKMELKAEDLWMVGDNLVWDIRGASQVGIFAVWNDYKSKGLPENSETTPELIVNSIFEMAAIIQKL